MPPPTQHARRLIVQFMAACCGKSTTHDAEEDEEANKDHTYEQPTNEMAVGRVHEILKCMSAEEVKGPVKKKRASPASNSAAGPKPEDATLEDEELEEGSCHREKHSS